MKVICYYSGTSKDPVNQEIRAIPEEWRDVAGMGSSSFRSLVMQDEVDILVDLSGHTDMNRLHDLSPRIAPLQVTYLGYPNTTGMAEFDYRITDSTADPDGASDSLYVEKLVRMNDCFLCYRPVVEDIAVSTAPCIDNGYITFGSFNHCVKMNDQVLESWSRILRNVPNSRLFLKARGFAEAEVRERFHERFGGLGIERDRVIISGPTKGDVEHLQQYAQVDLSLDTFPYCGTTTTMESLWMGVPVLTLRGDRHAARVGASILSSIGYREYIAENLNDYVNKAIEISSDSGRLSEARRVMRDSLKRSRLFDYKGFTRELEDIYRDMANRYNNER
jgi:predicted O-linked N-acetylglucosamine transferase (SPINDLY family)